MARPRANIRKARLQRYQTPYDGMTDAQLAEIRRETYVIGEFELSVLDRRMELVVVLKDLMFELYMREGKRVASQALALAKTLRKWKINNMVACVQPGAWADDCLAVLEPIVKKYGERTSTLYPKEYRGKPEWAS